jgi:hypothetical protein
MINLTDVETAVNFGLNSDAIEGVDCRAAACERRERLLKAMRALGECTPHSLKHIYYAILID